MQAPVYLINTAIDRLKWDKCIISSVNGNLYACSWYLDRVCTGWSALVQGDYESVMPMPVRKKYGITYLYQPFFVQQLGVFCKNEKDEMITDEFIKAIPDEIKFADYNFNFRNGNFPDSVDIVSNTTFHLSLKEPYENIHKEYAENTRRNIKKAEQAGVRIEKGLSPIDLVRFKESTASAPSVIYSTLREIVGYSVAEKKGEIYAAYSSEGKLCAAAFFAFSHGYAYMIVAASDSSGKENSAMFSIIDNFIREYSGTGTILDFEGSNIPGIARFFAGFGALPVTYNKMKFNRLPFYIKWLKK